jgi:hypothetical protein
MRVERSEIWDLAFSFCSSVCQRWEDRVHRAGYVDQRVCFDDSGGVWLMIEGVGYNRKSGVLNSYENNPSIEFLGVAQTYV